jgi:probable F420-dependent oxidoreductase
MDLARTGIWAFQLDLQPAARAREAAAELETLGYGSLWLPEVAGRDPFVAAALLLDATDRMVLATGIANIYARDAIAMASAQRTLTEAFPDRFLLGLGVSHQVAVEGMRGHDYQRPVPTMRAYLDAMDVAPWFAVEVPVPTRRVLGALGPKMLELAASRADGAHPYLVTPEHTAIAREVLGDGPLLVPEQKAVLETDADAARAIARRVLATYLSLPNYTNNLRRLGFGDDDLANGGSDRLVDALVVWGDEETVATRVAAHRAAGADSVCVQVLGAGFTDLPLDQWRRLAPALTA